MTATKPIKVCHMATVHKATDPRLFDKEGKSLAQAGYEVTIIATHPQDEVLDDIQIRALPKPQRRKERFVDNYARLVALVKQVNAQVYHFHDPELIPLGLLLKALGKKVVYDVHEDYEKHMYDKDYIPRWMQGATAKTWWTLEHSASRVFDAVLAADSLIAAKFPADRTRVITNVPPLSFLSGESRTRQADEPMVITYLGTITPLRGTSKAVEALKYVHHDDIRMKLIGPCRAGADEAWFASQEKVDYTPRIPFHEVRPALESAHLGFTMLQPVPANIQITGEGITKIYEYMAVGMPILVPNFPNLGGLIESLGVGRTVDPTDPQSIAAAFDWFYEHPDEAFEMGERGRKVMAERYNWEVQERVLLDTYRRIIGEP